MQDNLEMQEKSQQDYVEDYSQPQPASLVYQTGQQDNELVLTGKYGTTATDDDDVKLVGGSHLVP